MSERIKCPSCGTGLILPDSAHGAPATCPRCLAEISTSEAVQAAPAVQTERPERRLEPLGGHERGRYQRPDVDIRRDTNRTSVLVIALAAIGGIGVAWMGLAALGAVADGNYTGPLYLAVPLLFLAGVSTLIVLMRSGGNPGASGIRRIAVGTLALVGGLVLTTISVCIFFFIVCLATLARANNH